MAQLLRLVCGYRHRYPDGIPLALQQRIRSLYDKLVNRGLAYHLSLSPLPRKANRGRTKRRTGHNLLRRLSDFADDVLRCLSQPHVPFTNNQAERDLRMMKLKQKISGGFRSSDGAQSFATIRSVLSTARKQGCHLLAILTSAVQGYPPIFDL